MSARISAVARTPWALRHTALARARPEALLAAALAAAVSQAGIDPMSVDRLLVACDESVGAQHHNIGRRVAVDLGWTNVPALTADGGAATGLALVHLAAALPGRTVVAAVDVTSTVPPGAGLVRDYGRPEHAEPPIEGLEREAAAAGIGRSELDALATRLRSAWTGSPPPLVPVSAAGRELINDAPDTRIPDGDCPPLVVGGIQTADHVAEYADGAAALVVDGAAATGRPIVDHGFQSGPADTTTKAAIDIGNRAGARGAVATLVASAAVTSAAWLRAGLTIDERGPRPVLATGSTPSGDGLRTLVDAFHLVPGPCCVVRPGAEGQVSWIELGAAPA